MQKGAEQVEKHLFAFPKAYLLVVTAQYVSWLEILYLIPLQLKMENVFFECHLNGMTTGPNSLLPLLSDMTHAYTAS